MAKQFPFGALLFVSSFKPIIYESRVIQESIFFFFPFLIQKLPPHNLYKLPQIETEGKGGWSPNSFPPVSIRSQRGSLKLTDICQLPDLWPLTPGPWLIRPLNWKHKVPTSIRRYLECLSVSLTFDPAFKICGHVKKRHRHTNTQSRHAHLSNLSVRHWSDKSGVTLKASRGHCF